MTQWLGLRASFQTDHYRITLKIKYHFFTQFLANCNLKLSYIIIFLILLYNLKKKTFSTIWYTLGPSQQATVSLNYSQSIKIIIGPLEGETIVPSFHHIILKIIGFLGCKGAPTLTMGPPSGKKKVHYMLISIILR